MCPDGRGVCVLCSASQGASLVPTLFVIAGCMTLFVAAGKVAQKMRKGNQFLPITTEKQVDDEVATLAEPSCAPASAGYGTAVLYDTKIRYETC